jgi:hypothetical protein
MDFCEFSDTISTINTIRNIIDNQIVTMIRFTNN